MGSGCAISSSGQLDAAFNQGCVPPWFAANGTPSICNSSGSIPASHGSNYVCISSLRSSEEPPFCHNEAFVQNLSLCIGDTYTLSFDYRLLGGSVGRIKVYLGHGLSNVTLSPGVPCLENPGDWQEIADLAPSNTWVTFTSAPITISSTTNDQLILLVEAPTEDSHCNAGIDYVRLTCTSALIPQITTTYDDGQYTFTASTNSVPGLSVASYCWDFGDGTTATGQSVNHTFQYPGDYLVCLTITDNCGCIYRTCININNSCGCSETSLVLPTGTSELPVFPAEIIGQDIILPPGAHYTISGNRTLLVKNTCKFVVMRGASLTVNNSTLTNFCDGQTWQGIIVWGNSSVEHSSVNFQNPSTIGLNDPGVARVLNYSTIRHVAH